MESNAQDPHEGRQYDRLLRLISTITRGKAKPEAVASELKEEGFDTLDVILASLAQESAVVDSQISAQTRIDISQFLKPTSSDLIARIVHQIPRFPFVLNGTLYDPQDIKRFNGQEIHLIVTAPDEPLLAVNDRTTMSNFLVSNYLSSLLSDKLKEYQYGGHNTGGGTDNAIIPATTYPPIRFLPPNRTPIFNGVTFFQHAHYQGKSLKLPIDHAFSDLTRVYGTGFFGENTWNDEISSLHFGGASTVCILYEHIHYQGSALVFFPSSGRTTNFLGDYGWNDRASSVWCW
jgi:hypothetical protein